MRVIRESKTEWARVAPDKLGLSQYRLAAVNDSAVMKNLLGGPCRHNVADTRPPTTDSRKEDKP